MRGVAFLALSCAALRAQTPMPIGFVQGGFLAANGSTNSGEMQMRDPANIIYSCFYDSRTYVERAHERIAVTDLAPGEPIEVLADRRAGSGACYTRMVYVIHRHPLPSLDSSLNRPLNILPRGNMTFAGAVLRVDSYQLSIRTKAGDIALRVRKDTQYINQGLSVERHDLPVNAHIFVRAGRDIWGDLEAYKVMWGAIVSLAP